ncbi:DUF2062 domain-containing protein [Thioalkalivibrio sp.]|uniref:DUF2062 domain-containing protein n=1 Tax=Thioalkalivibrio sp. TaxID=2093813 RepID=UPI003569D34A
MLRRASIRWRALRWRAHNWLARHPRLHSGLHAAGSMKSGPEAMARGVAIGLFIGLTPTVGFQTVLMIILCIALAGNFPTALVASFVSNPFTTAPLYWAFHELGEAVFWYTPLLDHDMDAWYLQGFGDEITYTLLGSLLIATPTAMAGYWASRQLSAAWQRHRDRRRAERVARRDR